MRRSFCLVALIVLTPFCCFSQTLSDALDKKDTIAAMQLISKGGNVNALDKDGTSALMSACRWADESMVSFLLRHGATPDMPKSPKGRTPLMIACAYYSGKGICGTLIDHGANVNAAAENGTTPLMLAAQNAKVDVVDLLLTMGANVKAKDKSGKTALDYAQEASVDEYLTKSVKDTRLDKAAVVATLQKAMK